MARATTTDTGPRPTTKQYYALVEEKQYRLHRLARAVSGLSALAHDGTEDTAKMTTEIVQEDLSALFEMIGEQIEMSIGDMPFVSTH